MSLVGGPGTFRAMENENVIMRIDGDAGNLSEDHAVRKNRPAVNDSVGFMRFLLSSYVEETGDGNQDDGRERSA